jgi:hypothetical protein
MLSITPTAPSRYGKVELCDEAISERCGNDSGKLDGLLSSANFNTRAAGNVNESAAIGREHGVRGSLELEGHDTQR